MKKNISHFIGSFHQGGSEGQAVQLVRRLREDGRFNVSVITLNREGALIDQIERLGLPEIPEFKLSSFYDLNFLVQLRKCADFLKKENIEIIQTHDFYTNVFGILAARIAGVRLKIAAKRETYHMRSKGQKLLEKQVFRTCDNIVANSEAVRKYLVEEGIPSRKIRVIYNGLDFVRLCATKESNQKQIFSDLGIRSNENLKLITLVANLRHPVKNQPMFLKAAERVLQRIPEAHFVLAGEGELKNGLENIAKRLKIEQNVHFIGGCINIPELLSISYACVLTSFAEGFSNSILEYMGTAKPVVATNVGGASEVIIEGESGFLVESDDHIAMADRLIELLLDEEKAMTFGKNGKKFVEQKFSLETQLEKTLELYNR